MRFDDFTPDRGAAWRAQTSAGRVYAVGDRDEHERETMRLRGTGLFVMDEFTVTSGSRVLKSVTLPRWIH